jgi:alpha-D-ribose 1-methylphosphonate 5-triphosphate synthase subunit PhnH
MNGAPAHQIWRHESGDPAFGSQQTFRAVITAMEHPGQLITIRQDPYAPAIFNSASAAICLMLLDCETPVWTDIDWPSPAISWLQFGCNSSVVTDPCMANLAIVTKPATMPALEYFRIARYDSFENATTILVQVDDILPVVEYKRAGIWVDEMFQLELKGVPHHFWHQWRHLSDRHPLGIDIFFTCEDVMTVLPKTGPIEN